MSLAHDILDFCTSAAGSALAKDEAIERALTRLKRKARDAWEGAFVALHAPVAQQTWETRTILRSVDAESPLAKITYPNPVEIVGFVLTVVPVSFVPAPPLVLATNDDLLTSIAYDQQNKITTTDVGQVTTQAAEEAFTTATSLSILTPRLIGLRLGMAPNKSELQIKWRPKQGPNIFVDSIVSFATAVRFL